MCTVSVRAYGFVDRRVGLKIDARNMQRMVRGVVELCVCAQAWVALYSAVCARVNTDQFKIQRLFVFHTSTTKTNYRTE